MDEMVVADLMSEDVVTLKRNEVLSLAEKLMSLERVRHLPVVDHDDETLVGIVSQRDLFHGGLLQALGYGTAVKDKLLASLEVEEVMQSSVHTATPQMRIGEAARTMVAHKIGCLPVVEQGKVVGILTESDFVRLFAQKLQ